METLLIAQMLPVWIGQLADNMKKGDLRIHNGEKWDPSSWPKEAKGFGFHEAPRGALGHWIIIKDEKIANYQAVVPSTWGTALPGCERSAGGMGTGSDRDPRSGPAKPVEILRTVHSLIPASPRGHVVDPEGKEVTRIQVI